MQYCMNCGNIMVGVMSFSEEKYEKFCRCPKCCSETRHIKINDNELSFGEVLHRELNRKRK